MADNDFLKDLPPEDTDAERSQPLPTSRRAGPSTFEAMEYSSSFTSREAIRLVFKHKWTLFIPFILVFSAGIVYSKTAVPWYVAVARVQIEPSQVEGALPGLKGVDRRRNLINNQIELMLSDRILSQVVERLSLEGV